MIEQDYQQFAELWLDVHETMAGGKNLRPSALRIAFNALSEFSYEGVEYAVMEYVKREKFAPTPHHIIEIINEVIGSKHPSANEAWSLIMPLFDNDDKFELVTQEMLDAMAVVQDSYDAGDSMFNISKTFMQSYERATKYLCTPPEWIWVTGSDKSSKRVAVEKAVSAGRITHEQASNFCLEYNKKQDRDITLNELTYEAQKRLGNNSNVINLSEEIRKRTFAELHNVLNGKAISLEKSPSLLVIRHDKLLRKQHKKQLEQLKQQHPEQFENRESEDLAHA